MRRGTQRAHQGDDPVPRSAFEKVVVFTDAMYVHDGVYQAMFVWPAKDWSTHIVILC